MARLQARAAAVDAQDHKPATPTVYVIAPAVTLNTMEADDELLCGLYLIDRRKGKRDDVYRGLGDDPVQAHGILVNPLHKLDLQDLADNFQAADFVPEVGHEDFDLA